MGKWAIGRRAAAAMLPALLLALSGCAVSLISAYDQTTDDLAMTMQKAAVIHAEEMDQPAPGCFYARFRQFYREQHADISLLELRVTSIPKNDPTVQQVLSLRSALNSFESLHKSASAAGRCQSAAELAPAMSGLNSIFGAILKLEFAKKRGAP